MEVIPDGSPCPRRPGGTVVTIGVYDGVHLGHQALIGRVRRMAQELGAASAVVTFDRHPATVVRPDSAPRLLTGLDQRLELLAAQGVDYALVLGFDERRAAESAQDFVREVLVDCLGARAVVVGHDFHFGHRRGGNVALLQEMGADLGFDVLGINLVGDAPASAAVSSTRIRQAVAAGDVVEAARLLGRPYEVRGVVVRGDARGRDLGFPTANVAVADEILLPADGIYAGWYERPDSRVHAAAISVGRRPTFHPEARRSVLEAYLIDFDGDLYGDPARVRFTARVREEVKFDSVEALVGQMERDVDAARTLLNG